MSLLRGSAWPGVAVRLPRLEAPRKWCSARDTRGTLMELLVFSQTQGGLLVFGGGDGQPGLLASREHVGCFYRGSFPVFGTSIKCPAKDSGK